MKKRLIAALMAISMLIPSGSALAAEQQIYHTCTYVNPLYQEEMTAAELKTTKNDDSQESSVNYLTSESEICKELREALVERKDTITLHYESQSYDKTDPTRFLRRLLHIRESRRKAIISNGSMPDGMPPSRDMSMATRII